jgi:hypothetical protein
MRGLRFLSIVDGQVLDHPSTDGRDYLCLILWDISVGNYPVYAIPNQKGAFKCIKVVELDCWIVQRV